MLRATIRVLGTSLAAAAAATIIVLLVAALMGKDAPGILVALVAGPLGDVYRFADALGRACPLILCGLSVAIAFRCQAWNIGAEGQYLCGAMVAAAMGTRLGSLPGLLLVPCILLACGCAGAAFAAPAAWLENRRRVPLVLSTILLNFVAITLVTWLTQGPLRGSDPSAAQSNPIAASSHLPSLVAGTDLHAGFIVALIAAGLTWILVGWSTLGFAMRICGSNPTAAQWAGIHVGRVKLTAMLLSGGLAGLAGGVQVLGVHHLLNIQASEGFGYVGIAVALLGRLHPMGVTVAAIAIGMLDIGAGYAERQPQLGVPADLAAIIKGLLVICVLIITGPRWTRWWSRRRRRAMTTVQQGAPA